MNYITSSAEFSKIFINDSHVGKAKINLRFHKSMTEYDPLVEPENFNIYPVLLVHPEQDKWTPVRISKNFFDKISGEKILIILKGTGHYPYDEPGLQKMMEAIAEFIDRL